MANSLFSKTLLFTLAAAVLRAQAQVPLVDKRFTYPEGIPYMVDTDDGPRGTQQGYNICNGTTQNQNSRCQTGMINTIEDFCLWGAIDPNSVVGNVEGYMVAYCTQPNHGTRLFPNGTLRGVQFMRTPDYLQVVGFLDQTYINIQAGDYGGEMDPHGADLRGNPLGALMYSNGWNTDKSKYTQVIEWHNFLGSNAFCFKICDPARPNARRYCEHIYDRIGCAYNAPNNAKEGVFESCQGDNQDFPGVYTNAAGAVVTYQQPPESLGPITSIPYVARVPASSNCVTYTSADMYKAAATILAPGVTPTSSKPTSTSAPTKSGSGSAATATKTGTSGAVAVGVSGVATLLSVAFMGLFLA